MPFEIFRQHFGDLTEYVIHDTVTENRCVVVPELGGIVRQLSLRKNLTLFSILKTPPTPETLKNDTRSASELLFPFASRIPEGKYTFLGKEYHLAKNEEGEQNAIHGLVRKKSLHLEEQEIHSEYASITLSYLLDSPEGYPFKVYFQAKYTLHQDGRFTLDYQARNDDNVACPVMFGWHPYYQIGDEMVDAWKIIIPSSEIVTFNNNQIPTGKEAFHIEKPALLHRKEFDNCFIVDPGKSHVITQLISENQHVTLNVEQETGEGKFNFMVLYTPPARDCVAIEPLTGNVDSFNSGDGLTILAPGSIVDGRITVTLS